MKTTAVRVMTMPPLGLSADGDVLGDSLCCVSLREDYMSHGDDNRKKKRIDAKESGGHARGMPRPPAGQIPQCAHRPWRALPVASPSHRAFSADAALAHRLAELDDVVLSGPAHPPDPGPDVLPARTDVSFVKD